MGTLIRRTNKVWLKQIFQKRNYADNLEKLNAPHKVDNLEKKFLVWTGKYKTAEEVPAFVGQHVMERARNRMRIKIANYMMAATVVGCLVMVYLGKRDAKRGESLQKQNLEWHRKIKEEDEKLKNKSTVV